MFQFIQNLLSCCTSNKSENIVDNDLNEFDEDPLGWSRDLEEHSSGQFSMAAVQANGVMEDCSQVDVGGLGWSRDLEEHSSGQFSMAAVQANGVMEDCSQVDVGGLGWSRDLEEHSSGQFSMAAVQANGVMEDCSQVDVGDNTLFDGIYDGQNGAEASNFLSNNLLSNLLRKIQQNNDNMSENILRQVIAEMEEAFMRDVEERHQQHPELAIVGSSCLFCIVWKGSAYFANIGGSRAVMGHLAPFYTLYPSQMLDDHIASNKRIKKELLNLHPNEFDEDPLGWSRDLEEHSSGQFSMAAVQANGVMEDCSQVDVGNNTLFVGIYDGQNGAEASNFLSNNLLSNLLRKIQQNNDNMSENILRQVIAEMEEAFMRDVEERHQQHPELAIVGSSCLFCIVWKGSAYFANVGGSRAVMGHLAPFYTLYPSQMLDDYNASNKGIKNDLNIVTYNYDAWRVGGISEVSRCIGNAYLKRAPFTLTSSFQVPQSELAPADFTRPLLSAEPEIRSNLYNVDASSAQFLLSWNRYLHVPRPSRKRAILIGVEANTPRSIGSYTNVFAMRTMLMNVYHMSSDEISLLLDYIYFHGSRNPTFVNVCTRVLDSFRDSNNVDEVLLYFASHGHRQTSCPLSNNTCYNEQVLLANGTSINDDDLRELAKRAPSGVHFTVILDSCHSGGLVEGSYEQIGTSTFRPAPGGVEERALQERVEGRDLGLCMTSAQSSQAALSNQFYIGGAFTNLLIDAAYRRRGYISGREIVTRVSQVFDQTVVGYDSISRLPVYLGDIQCPGLYGSDYQCDRLFLGGPAL